MVKNKPCKPWGCTHTHTHTHYVFNKQKGVTLIALVVTIVVLLILAGVTIATLTGDNGLITKAQESKFKTEIKELQEEYDLWVVDKELASKDFNKNTVSAGKSLLSYNTISEEEKNGNIKTILKNYDENKYNIEIIKGNITLQSHNERELKWAKEAGIDVNPYEIDENGKLIASNTNLFLVDDEGTLVLPSTVKTIGDGAFANCEGLKKIIIPGNVKIIGSGAFSYNSTLQEVVIQDGVEEIGWYAFVNCSNLNSVQIANSVNKIGGYAFRFCEKLENINIPDALNTIRSYTFDSNRSLKDIDINNVEYIEGNSFSNCTLLEEVRISEKTKSIAASAFVGCSKLNNIIIPEKNKNFIVQNGMVLTNDGTKIIFAMQNAVVNNTLTIPNTITALENFSYQSLDGIKKVKIQSSVTSVSDDFWSSRKPGIEISVDEDNLNYMSDGNAVYSKDGKTLHTYFINDSNINVKESIETIKNKAFIGLSNLTNLKLPISLNTVESGICQSTQVTKLEFGENLSRLSPTFDAFSRIQSVAINSNNLTFKVVDNSVYSKDGSILVRAFISDSNSFLVPNGVTEIKSGAFYNRTVKEIKLPNTLKKLNGINLVSGLTQIEIPSSVETIENSCFSECSSLTSVIINKPKGSISGAPWSLPIKDRGIIWKE